ncbi:hypothetical protein JDV09_08120 [Mycobacterium sp. Y57]|uniref:hypothetical protein n=1 Tax=Mycolicibacterium xanthum TaxID=2796469 RepID=UPI001C8661DA|nr:hypothetical protein [Mycolicibacterium xanthum]MBX7432072.1 hypothetical protein [Mycolicibacterium xanthum]
MRHTHLGSIVGATAVAVAAVLITAPAANATPRLSEKQIEAECKDANGGVYSSGTHGSHRVSYCGFTDNTGVNCVDTYVDGRWLETSCNDGWEDHAELHQGLPPASVPPTMPTLSVAAPVQR